MTKTQYTQDEVVALMSGSNSEMEWNANASAVKAAFGGYPSWWYSSIIMSGVAARTVERWKDV